MFGVFKSKKGKKKSSSEQQIADELFSQIVLARDQAKSGGIIEESVFNDRLNHMFSAGYLIGYVDSYLAESEESDVEKKQKSKLIFEKMFPGTGFDFVRTKLALRQQAASSMNGSASYSAVLEDARHFDLGLQSGQEDVRYMVENEVVPSGLKDFLLIGEVRQA